MNGKRLVSEVSEEEVFVPSVVKSSEEVPLQTTWTFWLDKAIRNATAAEYQANLKKIYTVSTVQGFWSVFNNIPKVQDLSVGHYYHLMRFARQPLWEDPDLSDGGVWRLRCHKRDSSFVWQELMLAAIGEQLTDTLAEGDEVCGLSFSYRDREDIIQVWTKYSRFQEDSKILDKICNLVPNITFLAAFYKPHQTHSAFEGKSKA